MRTRICAALVLAFACGCHTPPLSRNPVLLASVAFEYGTNASLQINRTLKQTGSYNLYLNFQKTEMPRDTHGSWPALLETHFHVLVLTNGTAAVNERLDVLHFNSSHDPHFVRYSLEPFHAQKKTAVTCRVEDVSDGKLRVHARLIFERRFPK